MANSTTAFVQASFLNLFGIVVSIVLCVLFIVLGGHTLKYIKEFACKIKIIANRAEDKKIQLKQFNYQPREAIASNPSYQQWEAVFKNEIKRSRSLEYLNLLSWFLAKYDHVLYYVFRDRTSDKYNLLKPKTTFYTLLVVTSCCISWMTTILLTAILQNVYTDVLTIPLGVFIGVTVVIAIISGVLNIICINRLFRIYVLNVKGAFKIDYGHTFMGLNDGLQDYIPENSFEEEQLMQAQNTYNAQEYDQKFESAHKGDDALNMNSQRRLLGEEVDFERSDLKRSLVPQPFEISLNKSVLSQNKSVQNVSAQKRGTRIKDIFNMQVDIDGVEDADEDEKYIFVEDRHAIGDIDLLDNEAFKGENRSNIYTFVVLFIIIAASSAVCCYLNYTFAKLLSQYVFYMFAGAFFGDLLVVRVLLCMILALFRLCQGAKEGYRRLKYKPVKEIRQNVGTALKAMIENKQRVKDTRGGQKYHKHNGSQSDMGSVKGKMKGNDSGDYIMNVYQSTQNFNQDEDHKEEEYGVEKREEAEGPAIKEQFGNLDRQLLRPGYEMDQKQLERSMPTQAYHTQGPLLSNTLKQIREAEDAQHEHIMEKKQLSNDLVDYNLLLLRKIYDAFEERADKVLNNFRSDKHSVLRKRYMVPILNPNYDYERLLQEMREQGRAKDKIEEDEVKMDGETVCEDFEQQLIEAILEEAGEDLQGGRVDRQRIDKFGNPIDEDSKKNGVQKASPAPHFDQIQMEAEEIIEEDDEEARKRKMMEDLQRRLANGEELTEEELALLWQLEQERLAAIERRLQELFAKGLDKLTDDERLEVIDLKSEKLTIELGRLTRKKDKQKEDILRMDQIHHELKVLELEKLKLLQKLGRLTAEQLERLKQLEAEFNNKEWEELMRKLRDGSLTAEELLRLQQLMKELGIELNDEDMKRLRELQKKWGLLGQDELDKDLIEELRLKLKDGTLSKEELINLRQLEKQYNIQFTEDEKAKLRELEKKYGLLPQEEVDQDMIKELREKLKDSNLSKEECIKLREFEKQYNLQFNDEEKTKLRDLEKKYGLLSQEELDMDELAELRRKLLSGEITEDELRRLMELLQKYGIELSQDELDMLRAAEERFGMNDIEHSRDTEKDENFSELPPVVVMNKPETPENPFLDQVEEKPEEEEFNLLEEEAAPPTQTDNTPRGSIAASNDEYMKTSQIEFGREDIEKDHEERVFNNEEEESIYSHKTTTILDEEKVSFMHIEHLPNQDNGSEDSFSEQDMVYYNKDDLTNYSKGLGLNKVKAKMPPQNKYYSENDLQEVEEGELSENDQSRLSGRSRSYNKARSAMSLESSTERNRNGYSRANLQHQTLSPEDHSDLIDGRVKVDSWNLNYNGKKKKHRKRKVTKAQKKKMSDLQDIYGIDAKTLAGLSKGRLPRKLLASGKLKGDDKGGQSDGHYQTEMSFRSTQNTFANKLSTANKMKQSINDNMSNMFSFNGFGTNRNWGGPGGQGHGHPSVRDSRHEAISQFDKKSSNRKLPGKMTSTQQNFGPKGSQQRRPYDQNEFLEEESKSVGSSNNGRSLGRKFQTSNDQYDKQKGHRFAPGSNGITPSSKYSGNQGMGTAKSGSLTTKAAAAKKGNMLKKKSKKRPESDGLDSHTESDEAVDDKGAMFHKGGYPFNGGRNHNGQGGNHVGGMNDEINHSESDENLQENPDFHGNDFVFRKRDDQPNSSNKHTAAKQGASNKRGQITSGTRKSGSRSSGRLQIEDLEAQSMQGARNRKQGKSNRKPNFNGRADSAERDDSEEENLGGMVNFQRFGAADDTLTNSFNSRPTGHKGKSGAKGQQHHGSSQEDLSELNNIYGDPYNIDGRIHPGVHKNQKPGGSNNGNHGHGHYEHHRSSNNGEHGINDQHRSSNNGGHVHNDQHRGSNNGGHGHGQHSQHPHHGHNNGNHGTSINQRQSHHKDAHSQGRHPLSNRPGHQSDMSDNERKMRGTKYSRMTDEDENMMNMEGPRFGTNHGAQSQASRGGPQKSGFKQSSHRGSNAKPMGRAGNNRSVNVDQLDSDEDQNDFIVGPESNHSMIKKRGPRGSQGGNTEDEDDQYLLLQREREIIEEIESDQNENSRLAKKRKIRKAAQSHNTRDAYSMKIQEMQNARLKKQKLAAERALIRESDLETGEVKKKKKKQKKDWVKKEINYWLDYDSPYAEYLVARFREWSPSPHAPPVRVSIVSQLSQGGSSNSANRQHTHKFGEIQSVYNEKKGGSRAGSKQNSRSPNRPPHQNNLNRSVNRQYLEVDNAQSVNTSQRRSNHQVQQQQQQNLLSPVIQNVISMVVDDFEEP